MALRGLWDWIYRAGLSKQQIRNFILGLVNCDIGSRTAGILPEDLVKQIAGILSSQEWNCGDFVNALDDALEHPPPGFRWKTDKFGHTVLIKVRSEVSEQPIVKGKRFADDVFIGAWWTTYRPTASANRRLQNFIKRQDGSVFWNEKLEDGGRQYGAFIIVDEAGADYVAEQLCNLANQVEGEGGGEYRLSAIKMIGIAEHREVRVSDQICLSCICSIKFNWKYNLDDLLNGRIEAFKQSPVYKKLISQIRAQ